VLRYHAIESELAGVAEQVRSDPALVEGRDEDAVGAARQQPCKVGLAHGQRQRAEVVAVERQRVDPSYQS
jgi:hypothetical protein